MPRKTQFACLFLVLGLLSTMAPSGFAQNAGAQNGPFNVGNNFLVTGDYALAGAYNVTRHFTNINGTTYAVGTISFPDANPGIRGTTTVPRGANIVAALLYWQTVENAGVVPGQPGSGQNGFFRPVFTGGPQAPGYSLTGVNLGSDSTVTWSQGGCTSTQTEKFTRTYRADVRGFLPLDANGNVLVDSADGVTFEVRLPSVGPQTPLTLGATLVLIYRVVSPNFPLNAITIYDGAFGQTTSSLTMTQTVHGFYEAAQNPVSRLTYIAGHNLNNKFQTVYLSGGQNGIQRAAVALPSPYGTGQAFFPGWYGNWDNTTLMFPDAKFPNLANPLHEKDDSATTMIVPSPGQAGCVSSAAVIVATTVHDDDKDGIPPVWKTNKGYTDVATGQFVSLDDPNDEPKTGQQDIFIQMDHVVDANGDFTPDPAAVNMVKNAFLSNNHNIHLHFTDASQTTGIAGANVISEPACVDKPLNSPPQFCPYPNQPGVTSWRGGFEFVKNQPVNYPDESSCESAVNPPCVRRFPIAQRNSHHYVVFGDTLGAPNWTFLGGILTDSTGKTPGLVAQKADNTVTFYTSNGHGLTVDNTHTQPNGRVTVSNAITNLNLNGTFFVSSVSCPPNPDPNGTPCDVTNKAPGPYSFTITIGGHSVTANYTLKTDPDLEIASGQAATGSGLSDLGGAGTLVTLGQWRLAGDDTVSAQAGTLMHELGHTLGLAIHGGSYYDKLVQGQAIPDYRPTIEANCKSNYQSVMSYMFQTRLLPNGVLDYSSQQLSPLDETKLGAISTTDARIAIAFPSTDWYDTQQTLAFGAPVAIAASPGGATESGFLVTITTTSAHGLVVGQPVSISGVGVSGYNGVFPVVSVSNNTQFTYAPGVFGLAASGGGTVSKLVPVGTPATHHCDDTPLKSTDPMTYFYQGGTVPLNHPNEITIPWSNIALDANFEGSLPGSEPPFRGYNDWANLDLRQVGATGSSLVGPGGLFGGPGGFFGGPGGFFGGPGGFFGGPGGFFGGPGGLFGGPGELDLRNALSVVTAPTGLAASEAVSARTIMLTLTEPNFPATDHNNIYRSPDGVNFTFIASVPGAAPGTQKQATDTVTCNPNGYSYFVTTVIKDTTVNPAQFHESTQSNIASTGQNGQPITGCYTPPVFSSPVVGSSPLQASMVPVTWTLKDASNNNGASANNPGSNTLIAIGPVSNDVVCGAAIPPGTPRSTISSARPGITFDGISQFTFQWNTNTGFSGGGAFPPGCYLLEDDLDSGQPALGGKPASAFQVQLYLSDVNESVVITTTSPLPDATVGGPYNQTLQENGGVPLLNWTLSSGSLPLPPALPAGNLTLNAGNGVLSGTPSTAGTYNFTPQVTDSIGDFGTKPLMLTVHIFVSTSQPPAVPPFTATTTLTPNAVVGSLYNNTVYESGGVSDGVKPFTWTIVPGSLTLNGSPTPDGSLGISFQPNTVAGGNNGALSGTPTAPGTYTFTAMVTDSAGNTGTLTLITLNVADALFGDLVVVDGPPSNTPSGTLLRVTQTGTTTGTIATISTGQPNGVAVDANSGNIYASVAPLAGVGTAGVVQVSQFGATSSNNTFYNSVLSSGVLKNPVAVAVDSSGNVYVADNQADAIYKFSSSGTLLNPSPFAPLPVSSVMHVRMAFDSNGNLIVASDKVNGATGVIEVDQVAPGGGVPTPLYNTLANAGLTDGLTAVNASANITSFAITNNVVTLQAANNFTAGTMVQIKGLTTGTYLDGQILQVLPAGLTGAQFAANFNNPPVPSTIDSGAATSSATITGFSITSNVVTFQAANTFAAGTMVQINSLSNPAVTSLNGQTVAVQSASSTQFTLNFNSSDTSSTGDSGTATASAGITSFAISNNIVTIQAANTFGAGTTVQVSGLSTGTYLNGQTLTLLSASGSQFTANFNNPNVPSTNDSGTATSQTAAYTGTFSPPLPVGSSVAISGFSNNGNNSPTGSPFTVVSCTSTTLVVNNSNGVTEPHAGTATFGIASVGGVATFPDGSIDVADSSLQSIYKITTTPSLAVAPDISTTNALCCNISGITNPSQGTTLFVTLDQAAQALKAVPPSTVTIILNGKPLTFSNDVTWYSKP